ncbi:prepilin-type N-terminal cleavage/methylation domain-containing protein [Xenophilus arseniciresistens]|uniref:Prepilin-type N-terminal cleavage/methylation domain-containing protein n=1 Tax=Xenophilus arseniciresistens TaxID=1283306 RepID=A0AAE3N925_9BURK|nr:prepilin-type N-terminal cleavage/methylation domain-containing protein [Xenophilus arseniciresistens]MDA7416769.1 prepilin-type N-terminal cleavage/methylation domain-containing protein [Xenophilus arseniciresistens]
MPFLRPRHRRRSNNNSRGFTLIELLVALSAMALLALMSWRGVDALARTQSAHQARDDSVLVLQTVLAQWRADLDAAASPDGSTAPLAWDGRTFRLTRRIQTGGGPALQVVAWTLRSDSTGPRWWRWQSVPLRTLSEWNQAWSLGAQSLQDGVPPDASATPLLPLTAWSVAYYANGVWSSNAPASTGSAAVGADGVRLVLDLPASTGLAGTITQDWLRPTHGVARSG